MILEKDIERKLTHLVVRHGGLGLKWVCPGWSGVPDRIVLMPGGRVYFVETKRPYGARIGELQKWWAARLTRLGFRHFFIIDQSGLDAFTAVLEERT